MFIDKLLPEHPQSEQLFARLARYNDMLTSIRASTALLTAFITTLAMSQDTPAQRTWRVRIDPVDIGSRKIDERPAEFVIDVGDERLDVSTLRAVRINQHGEPAEVDGTSQQPASLPLRWYDAAIPYEFPELMHNASGTGGKLEPSPRTRGGYYLNAMGDGHRGRLVWMHTQRGRDPAWYRIEAQLLAPGAVPQRLAPQGWIGDGQAR